MKFRGNMKETRKDRRKPAIPVSPRLFAVQTIVASKINSDT